MSLRFNRFFKELVNVQKERGLLNIPPLPLNIDQTVTLCDILENNEYDEEKSAFLLEQLKYRIVPGVDETSYVKANFLNRICKGNIDCNIINERDAISILGTMQGGYNVNALIKLLEVPDYGGDIYNELRKSILTFDGFYDIESLMKGGNLWAFRIMESWAKGEWFTDKKALDDKIPLTIFKVSGEINTDDLSPAPDAWSRPDIPLHSRSMLKSARQGIIPDIDFEVGPMKKIEELKALNNRIAFVGDVVGTGSSRKSATNSILWHFGKDIPYVPNKKNGGFCFGGKIAPIFYSTMEDSGAFPIEMDVSKLHMGDVVDFYPHECLIMENNGQRILSEWKIDNPSIFDSVRGDGRINVIIGKSLQLKARESIKLEYPSVFFQRSLKREKTKFTLAQKIIGRACGMDGVEPGMYCEPIVTSVGSQDTTGPMTRDELKDLACLGFSADLVMQSFCHTAAYPKPVDVVTHNTLPDFIRNRGGISLRPGDGIIHSWLNRMLLPDTLGTGGDSHTRFPLGISFPAGSGLVAFAAASGIMPLDVPESVLVRFVGEIRPGITLRDLVHSIPYQAKKRGLLTIEKKGKKNIFNASILEIEGLPHLKCEQAFELSDATAERSAAGCTIKLDKEPIIEYLNSNIVMLKWMIREGYGDTRAIERRIERMESWIETPVLLDADDGAEYKEKIIIDLQEITEPILCAPNDPDDAVLLSEVSGTKVDEVFIGSCMTNIGHFRISGELLKESNYKLESKLWIAPPTKMDRDKLVEEGYYEIFDKSKTKIEIPGCSLCMGNQARVEDDAVVLSTSTRNFPNRLGRGAQVYLASAELSIITAILGEIPTVEKYNEYMKKIKNTSHIYKYLNFNELEEYLEK